MWTLGQICARDGGPYQGQSIERRRFQGQDRARRCRQFREQGRLAEAGGFWCQEGAKQDGTDGLGTRAEPKTRSHILAKVEPEKAVGFATEVNPERADVFVARIRKARGDRRLHGRGGTSEGRTSESRAEETEAKSEADIDSGRASWRHGCCWPRGRWQHGGLSLCVLDVWKGSGVEKKDEEQRGENRSSFV